jgi:hypothetical protein
VTKKEAMARARAIYKGDPLEGEEPRDATRRWIEIMADPSKPGPIRDTLCWVVEICGDSGATCDLVIADATGELLRREGYS